jgi:hypothetical protein
MLLVTSSELGTPALAAVGLVSTLFRLTIGIRPIAKDSLSLTSQRLSLEISYSVSDIPHELDWISTRATRQPLERKGVNSVLAPYTRFRKTRDVTLLPLKSNYLNFVLRHSS